MIQKLEKQKIEMKKSLRLIVLLAIQCVFAGFASAETIKGVVTDSKGESIIGATVREKGTNVGTITDIDGKFNITVKSTQSKLVFSYVGYTTLEMNVTAQMKVILQEDAQSLDEVVVTALGIKREKKSLGYAIQEVKGEDLTKVKSNNVMNSLAGRVAGLKVSTTGTGEWGSTNILLRGATSLSGDNQPLIVVDGIPVSGGSRGNGSETGGIDYGSGLSDINPDDIETISVLKGGNAAALYGSRGGKGVILITTKKGSAKKTMGVKYSYDLGVSTLNVLPNLQNEYGRQTEIVNGVEQEVLKGTNWADSKLDGHDVKKWNDEIGPFTAQPDNIRDFFQTGFRNSHSVELDGGNEKAQARLSVLYSNATGIIPNSSLDKYSFSLSGNAKLTNKLSIIGRVNYNIQNTKNRPNLADSPDNPMYSFLRMPRNIQLDDMRTYEDANGFPILWDGLAKSYTDDISKNQNPFWSIYKNYNNDNRYRLMGNMSLKYDFTSFLSLMLRAGTDYILDDSETRVAKRTAYENNETRSKYAQSWGKSFENNYDYLLTFNKSFLDNDLSLVITQGGNIMQRWGNSIGFYALALSLDNLYTVGNAKNVTSSQGFSQKLVQSIYGSASFGYKSYVFLDLTARNDWDSSLQSIINPAASDVSYFYPSVSVSGILTDAIPSIKSDWLSYLKVRLSSARVGNGTSPYRTSYSYSIGPGHLGQQYAYKPDVKPFVDLKPELMTSNEVGIEAYLLKHVLKLDATYYINQTSNQIIAQRIPSPSGYTTKLLNAGLVQNQGVEFQLTANILEKKDVHWDVFVNFSRNRDKIIILFDPAKKDRRILASAGTISIHAKAGGRYGEIYGTKYLRNDKGERIIGANGLPQLATDEYGSTTENYLGNIQNDFIGGLGTNFSYKGISFSALVDVRMGGKLYSFTEKITTEYGNAPWTTTGREEWTASETARIAAGKSPVEWFNSRNMRGYLPQGVVTLPDGSYTPNRNLFVSPQAYWINAAGVDEEFLHDASFVKFKEIRIGYNLPKKWLKPLSIENIQLAAVGRNLFYIYKAAPEGLDPEASFNGMGFEYSSVPTTREWGLSANISF